MTAAWRPARADEDDAVVALALALYGEDPGPRDPDAAQLRRTLAAYRAEPLRGRALVLGDAPLGYAFLSSVWSNELGGEVCVIDELYVAPAARSRGHASALVRRLAGDPGPLWPRHPVALELVTTPANVRARALYARLGFREASAALRLVP